VGTKKFSYDIWGDTVNVASRMESMSAPGKINISENTFKLVREQTECQYRGKIEVKNRGMMKMYFVERIKSGVQV
jgi:class 3 adenylate cyclase